jgi:hypothetical protein
MLPLARKDTTTAAILQNKDQLVSGLTRHLVVDKSIVEAVAKRCRLGVEGAVRGAVAARVG